MLDCGRLRGVGSADESGCMHEGRAEQHPEQGHRAMLVGVPKEVKDHEFRVAVTPSGAREYGRRGHRVLVQRGAGEGSGFTDPEYAAVGADLVDAAEEVFARADMIVKVKEPVPAEF